MKNITRSINYFCLMVSCGLTMLPIVAEAVETKPIEINGYAHISFRKNTNSITSLTTTTVVPAKPIPHGTLFIWPGLQPAGATIEPVRGGVLQPVLTWGLSCAPQQQPQAFSTWWISAQYVNTTSQEKTFRGCKSGPVMAVNPGDTLKISMKLEGSVWKQHVLDATTQQSVDYSIDLVNEPQTIAIFMIESHYDPQPIATTFTDSTITFTRPDPNNCVLTRRGIEDQISKPVVIKGGQSCFVKQIVLKMQGADKVRNG